MKVGRRVKQGDLLSPNLFNCVIEEIFRNLNWENREIKINGEYFNHLRYADDVVLIAENTEKLKTMVEELNREGRKGGLEINYQKTKILGKEEKLIYR